MEHKEGAFTLIEMLLVVAIMGILITMLAPRLQMMGAPRVTAAARVLTQTTRYARTMALLHQAETVLHVSPMGLIRVSAAGAPAAVDANEFEGQERTPFFTTETAPMSLSVASAERGILFKNDLSGTESEVLGVAPAAAGAASGFAEEVAVERQLDNVTVTFLGYTDVFAADQALVTAGDIETTGVDVRFRSNGTCRPHRYKLTDATGTTLVVVVDLLGMSTVLTGEEGL